MKRWIIFLAVVAVFIAVWVLVGRATDNTAPKEQIDTTESDSVVRENEPLPEAFNIVFPDELPELNFPCASLKVSDDVKKWQIENADVVSRANARNKALLERVILPFEIVRGREDTNSVALTVDTGTVGDLGVSEILDIAKHYDIPVTFFVTGCWVLENPELTQRIIKDGHTLGHHSLTHLNLKGADEDDFARELDEPIRIIVETTGVMPVLFRKPQYAGGDVATSAAGERGMISVQGWPDLGDTMGWSSDVDADGVLKRIKNRTDAGAIWVLHNLSLDDLKAFEDMVRFHLEEGYNLVSLEDLIE